MDLEGTYWDKEVAHRDYRDWIQLEQEGVSKQDGARDLHGRTHTWYKMHMLESYENIQGRFTSSSA